MQTKTIYEVMVWADADNPQCPDIRSIFARKSDAMKLAKESAREYGLVEVNSMEVDIDDEDNMDKAFLVASWRGGRKTATENCEK